MANVNELLGNVNASIERMLKNNSTIEKDLALEKIRNLYDAVINFSATQKNEIAPKPQPTIVSMPSKIVDEKIIEAQIPSPLEKGQGMRSEFVGEIRSESLNEILVQSKKTELADKLEHSPITDLKAAISFNDRFSFVQNLFSGNAEVFKNVVEQINSVHNFEEAEKIISNHRNEKWAENADAAASFMELVSRRFAKQS
jgi:hypothetical protein